MNKTFAATGVVIVAVLAFFIFPFSTGQATGTKLPSYATYNSKIKEAYLFAAENPDGLDMVNCYCGCMLHAHDGRIHKRGLLDCFMKNGGFERHASECDMCINDALAVKKWIAEGKSKEEIQRMIDAKYAQIKH